MADPIQITLLHGSDEFAISAAIDKLCAGLGDAATAGMNITRFDGRAGLDAEALNTAVNAMPFLAPRRVMVLIHPGAAFSSPEARKKFWLDRKRTAAISKHTNAFKINEDVVIPLERLGDYTDGVERLNIEMSLRNKLKLAERLASFLSRNQLFLRACHAAQRRSE